MWKHILVCSFLLCGVVVLGYSGKFISKGRWVVERTERCEDYESYPYDLNLQKKKLNRTHDVFYGKFGLLDDITEDDFGIYIEACKKVDGGCKLVSTMEDESLCRFIVKHAEENFKEGLKNIGVEEHCPIPKGEYNLTDFMFDNTELPDDGMVGSFMATIMMTKGTEKMGCVIIHAHFDDNDE